MALMNKASTTSVMTFGGGVYPSPRNYNKRQSTNLVINLAGFGGQRPKTGSHQNSCSSVENQRTKGPSDSS